MVNMTVSLTANYERKLRIFGEYVVVDVFIKDCISTRFAIHVNQMTSGAVFLRCNFRNCSSVWSKIGFLDAFDESKDERLQQGFEDGYRETFDVSLRVGKQLGRTSIIAALMKNCSKCKTCGSRWGVSFSCRNHPYMRFSYIRPCNPV